MGNWTTLDTEAFGPATIETIKKQYISNVGLQIAPASEEGDYAFDKLFLSYEGVENPDKLELHTIPRSNIDY